MIIANYKCPSCQRAAVQSMVGNDGFYIVPRLFCDCNGNREVGTMVEMEITDFGKVPTSVETPGVTKVELVRGEIE